MRESKLLQDIVKKLAGTVVHACHMSILEAEAGRWLQVQGQPRLLSEHHHKVSKRECIEMDPRRSKAIS